MKRTAGLLAALLGLCACASETPELDRATSFDDSAGKVAVVVLGDGFVRCGERRLPLEAIVLELRQRIRAMPREELSRFVVELSTTPQQPGSPAAAVAQQGVDRLFSELQIMGVQQARLF